MKSQAGQFARATDFVRDTAKLEATQALLEWDERTYLPSQGGAYRAEQVTMLSGIIHRRRTDPHLGEQLEELRHSELAQSKYSDQGATIAKLSKDFSRYVKLPVELVQAMSRATMLGQQAWSEARKNNRWLDFAPHLETIISLKREEAVLLAVGGPLYDALLDQYEDGAKSEAITATFAQLRDGLVPLVETLSNANERPDGRSWKRPIDIQLQRAASRWIAQRIGYSFERGRLDETDHPFCTTIGPADCRILTRFQLEYFPSGFYGTLHEAGHGLYEQGLRHEWYGLPPGAAASLGVHESQSRLWENFVGRSQSFWRWCFPELQRQLNSSWSDLSAEQLYRDANLVRPSLIRVEADEVTYNLHILIRFELEQELFRDNLRVADARDAWNDRYEKYLGIRPERDSEGILQDIHWSAGLVGYFPTYTLGNLYAAQLFEAADRDQGGLDRMFAAGDFAPLLDWLREKIHRFGRCYQPVELVQQATGVALSANPLLEYLRKKLRPIYRVDMSTSSQS